jgi:uncharacterized surface protein with fasciclin (FAS1) repeats
MKNLMKKIGIIMSLFALVLVAGCSKDEDNPMSSTAPEPTVTPEPALDIVETAVAAGNFKTLIAAVEAADLVDALKSEGPLTVFAPTDDAFAALPEGTVEALLQDTDALTAILTYHVAVGAVTSDQVVKLPNVPTLNGAELTITVTDDGMVKVDNATVIVADIETSNGIIHVIDAVVIPGTTESGAAKVSSWFSGGYRFGGGWIADAIQDGHLQWLTKRLSLYTVARLTGLNTLTTAVKAAGLKYTLLKEGPFTVFGPTEDAFAALPDGTVAALLQDPETLANILLYHVVPGVVKAEDVVNLTEATMANGQTVSIYVNDGVMVNDANVIVTDIMAKNGVIHLIDKVLIP